MKGENYLYFQDDSAEADGTNKCVMIPASRVLGVSVGNHSGEAADEICITYQGLTNTGTSYGAVRLGVTNGKQAEAMDHLVDAINSNPSDGFVVILDIQNQVFCSPYITGGNINTTV